MKTLEIERRWLVHAIHEDRMPRPDTTYAFKQGYWRTPTPSQSMRVRIIDDVDSIVTVKTGTGLIREEKEFPVGPELGRFLLETCIHHIEKTRTVLGPWLLDRFGYPLSGIILLERELASPAEEVRLPEWIAEADEVTECLTSRDLARLATRLRRKQTNPLLALDHLLAKRR